MDTKIEVEIIEDDGFLFHSDIVSGWLWRGQMYSLLHRRDGHAIDCAMRVHRIQRIAHTVLLPYIIVIIKKYVPFMGLSLKNPNSFLAALPAFGYDSAAKAKLN